MNHIGTLAPWLPSRRAAFVVCRDGLCRLRMCLGGSFRKIADLKRADLVIFELYFRRYFGGAQSEMHYSIRFDSIRLRLRDGRASRCLGRDRLKSI